MRNEETVARVVDMVTAYFKDLTEDRLKSVLDFGHKLNEESETEVLNLVKNKLRRFDMFSQLKIDIDRHLENGPWKLPLGDRKEEKIVLIILVSTLHYSSFVLSYVRKGVDKVQEYVQSINADELREGVVSLQKSGNDTFQKTKKAQSQDYTLAIADYNKALQK